MSHRYSKAVAILCLLTFSIVGAATADPSPTGREPKLLWTPAQQSVWNRMVRENHPWWGVIRTSASNTGTPNARYGDNGQWASLAFQITGDRTFAEKAMLAIRPYLSSAFTVHGNFTREHAMEFVIMYDWLYPALSESDRNSFVSTLNGWAEFATTNPYLPNFPIPQSDSDQVIGDYFFLTFFYLTTQSYNPYIRDLYARSFIGGMQRTAIDRSTLRNTISQYALQMAYGGQWIEGTEYNEGTLKLLLMGIEGVRTATGVDHFADVRQVLPALALGMLNEHTSDLRALYQWGDSEKVRNLMLYNKVATLGMFQGLLQDDPSSGPYVNQFITDLAETYGYVGYGSAEPWSRIFYFYNPYAPRSDWRSLPNSFFAGGQNIWFYHHGRGPLDTMLGIHFPQLQQGVHHQVTYFGDFQLYRRGEWAITHPIDYAGPSFWGAGTNTMLHAGIPTMNEVKRVVAREAGANDSYIYFAGTNLGQFYELGSWGVPPTYLHEWTRSFFYLPSEDKKSDTIVIFDRSSADNPKLLPGFDRYSPPERDKINAAPAVKQWVIHSVSNPSVNSESISWRTPGGQNVRVNTLLPADQTRTVVDEDSLWPDQYPYPDKAEQKWHTIITPAQEKQWDTFLNVVQVYDNGAPLQNTLIRAAGGESEGVLVQRGNHRDSVILFGARQTARVFKSGYTVNWTSATIATEVYLLDLDPTFKWTALVNGKDYGPVPVSSQGVGRLTINESGAITLKLADGGANGTYSLNASPTAATVGAQLAINWTAPVGTSVKDWIGLFKVGASNDQSVWRQYTNGASLGSFQVTAPAQEGNYEFRYLLNDSFTEAARSSVISLSQPARTETYTVAATPSSVTGGAEVTVSWTAPSGSSGTDWVGLYRVGSGDNDYMWWRYTRGEATGSRAAKLPLAAGQYEFRYFVNNGFERKAKSAPVTVTNSYTVKASPGDAESGDLILVSYTAPADASIYDWVGMFPEGAANTAYIQHSYTYGAQGTLRFAAPETIGRYEFRYFVNNGYETKAVSNTVTVAKRASAYSLVASPETVARGTSVDVKWTAPEGSAHKDWIGLYKVGHPDSAYITWKYTGGMSSGTMSLSVPNEAGKYEFRYFVDNGFIKKVTSNPITVN